MQAQPGWSQQTAFYRELVKAASLPIRMLRCKPRPNSCFWPSVRERQMATSMVRQNSTLHYYSHLNVNQGLYSNHSSRNVKRPVQTQCSQAVPATRSLPCKLCRSNFWTITSFKPPPPQTTHRLGAAGSAPGTGGRDGCWERAAIKIPSNVPRGLLRVKKKKKKRNRKWMTRRSAHPSVGLETREADTAQQLLYIVLHRGRDNELAVFSRAKSHKSMWPLANRLLEQHTHPRLSIDREWFRSELFWLNSRPKCPMILLEIQVDGLMREIQMKVISWWWETMGKGQRERWRRGGGGEQRGDE